MKKSGGDDAAAFRAALLQVAPDARDAWLDAALGIGEIPDDGPELPRDGVPYLPCPVDALLRMVDEAAIGPADVFVDIGAGIGRAAAAVHLLTGAPAIALEIQPHLARASRELAARLGLGVATVEADASRVAELAPEGTVFFLYCPFSGARLERVVDDLAPLARKRPLRVCTVDVPLPARAWLAMDPPHRGDLAIYRTRVGQV